MGAQKLLTLDQAIDFINRHYQVEGTRNVYSKKTLYNMISRGDLKRFGPRHMVQVDQSEIQERLCK